MAEILASKVAVPFSYLLIMDSGLRENENSVFLGGIPLLQLRIEKMFGDLVLVSINTFSNCSKNGIKT
jgi:hypothetical protein